MTGICRINRWEEYCPVCGGGGIPQRDERGVRIHHAGRPGIPCRTDDVPLSSALAKQDMQAAAQRHTDEYVEKTLNHIERTDT